MFLLASLRSDRWTTCPELVDDFIGIRSCLQPVLYPGMRHQENRPFGDADGV